MKRKRGCALAHVTLGKSFCPEQICKASAEDYELQSDAMTSIEPLI